MMTTDVPHATDTQHKREEEPVKRFTLTQNKSRAAFTLIEMLIVIMILGILAMVIIPQISTSTDDAKLSTLKTNLSSMRNAVELYYAQHNSAYPGAGSTTNNPTGVGSEPEDIMVAQLTRYTDVGGNISNSKTAVFKYGPYIKGTALPKNPFNELDTVVVDATAVDITAKASST